jgi:hypothetical protein
MAETQAPHDIPFTSNIVLNIVREVLEESDKLVICQGANFMRQTLRFLLARGVHWSCG